MLSSHRASSLARILPYDFNTERPDTRFLPAIASIHTLLAIDNDDLPCPGTRILIVRQ
jgi:hypothetical protein